MKPLIAVPPKRRIICQCQHHKAIDCAAIHYQCDVDLVVCLYASCSCRCHRTADGGEIGQKQWEMERK